ncbi:beta-defensin 127 [Tupaia chinensis]|uniref:beta-defensin 127 n=1 Tax=Tupaia chinensis TaxID=246437 RepID=UPI0003C8C7EF|nr:beta-defensin 127 [Tupaia chinensis]
MRLFLIIAILLFQKPTVTNQLKKCWGNYVQGNCRKICKITEIREVLCTNGRYCCLNIKELEERKKITKPPRPEPPIVALTLPQEYDEIIESSSVPQKNSTQITYNFLSFTSQPTPLH